MRPFADYVGRTFGRWTVLAKAKSEPYRDSRWLCRCECGTERVVYRSSMTLGKSTSCGCRSSEVAAARHTTHGESKRGAHTPEYRTWRWIKKRCLTPSYPEWQHYGGRGIKICKRWRDSYENFLADMGRKPSPEHSIDRINVDGDYKPSNCRWATTSEQNRNRRGWVIKPSAKLLV